MLLIADGGVLNWLTGDCNADGRGRMLRRLLGRLLASCATGFSLMDRMTAGSSSFL